MTRRKRRWFRVKDDGRTFDGVAGATWCLGQTTLKTGLARPTTQTEIEHYARETFISKKYVQGQLNKNACLPRSLCGLIVEVNNKPWGVIVIDASVDIVADQQVIEAFYRKNAKILGKLLAVL